MVMEKPSTSENSTRDWLCPIPAHWDVRRNGRLFRELKLPGRKDLPILTVSIHDGVAVRDMDDQNHRQMMEDKEKYQSLRKGDIAYNMMRMWQGAVGVAPVDGLVSPAYVCARPHPEVNPKYYEYLFRTPIYKGEVEGYSRGIVSDRNRLYWEGFKQIPSPYPPIEEQDAIVAFLDHKLEEIDHFITNKHRLIELLDEGFQRTVDRLTRNGNSEAEFVDSRIDWIGDVPSHWKITPLKHAFSSMEYGISDSGNNEGTIPVLTMGHIHAGEVTVPSSGGVAQIESNMLLQDGDLLFNRTNSLELVGKVGRFEDVGHDVTFASYLVRLRPKLNVDSEYMNYVLNSPSILRIARQNAIPSLHQANLNPTRYGRIHIALPPFEEQKKIRKAIKRRHEEFDNTRSRYAREIELMKEFRTSLIAEAVTGKIDVRARA